MTQKLKVYIVQNFADKGKPYYGFNYVENGRTNAIHVHRNHPIFQKVESPKPRKGFNQQKYIITADLSSKTKTEYGIKYYIYNPENEIENLERVEQCWGCQSGYVEKGNYDNCECSCEGIDNECNCYQQLVNKVEVKKNFKNDY
ncbi:MAG: hypothetical protein mread185_000135 [Mycoplasmataceae bacterium]|nr:MAG: hypothetical protein mread185_000135 [Mycoplasmataceae bacterium]